MSLNLCGHIFNSIVGIWIALHTSWWVITSICNHSQIRNEIKTFQIIEPLNITATSPTRSFTTTQISTLWIFLYSNVFASFATFAYSSFSTSKANKTIAQYADNYIKLLVRWKVFQVIECFPLFFERQLESETTMYFEEFQTKCKPAVSIYD